MPSPPDARTVASHSRSVWSSSSSRWVREPVSVIGPLRLGHRASPWAVRTLAGRSALAGLAYLGTHVGQVDRGADEGDDRQDAEQRDVVGGAEGPDRQRDSGDDQPQRLGLFPRGRERPGRPAQRVDKGPGLHHERRDEQDPVQPRQRAERVETESDGRVHGANLPGRGRGRIGPRLSLRRRDDLRHRVLARLGDRFGDEFLVLAVLAVLAILAVLALVAVLRPGRPRGLGPGLGPDLLAERLVDVDQHLLLSLGDLGVGRDRVGDGALAALPVVEYPGLNVERLGRDPQPLRDLLENVRARPAQAALDLAQIRVRYARGLGELADRGLGLLPLLADVGTDGVDVDRAHIVSFTSNAGNSKCPCRRVAAPPTYP